MDRAQEIRLTWDGEDRFSGTAGGVPISLDGASVAAPSPTQSVAAGLAACMAIDVAMILRKGRLPLAALEVIMEAERAQRPPRRFISMRALFRVTGDIRPDRVERAIALSRETYCSVLHSLRRDIAFETAFEIVAG